MKIIFIPCQIIVAIHTILTTFKVFAEGSPMIDFIQAMYTCFMFNAVWPLSRGFFPKLSKYVICAWFVLEAIVTVYCAFNQDTDSIV
jgi:hypothetical protein